MHAENISWLGHAGIKVTDGLTVVVDPYQITGGFTADIILITHEHYDHFSLKDIDKIRNPDTMIVVPQKYVEQFSGNNIGVEPGDALQIKGIEIKTVPAYNIGKPFHPKACNYMGYVFTINGTIYYHAGDTDLIPEMKGIRTDIAFLPVEGTYTMNAREAAEAADIVHAGLAIPIHWGSVVGGKRDAEAFAANCPCEVRILNSV